MKRSSQRVEFSGWEFCSAPAVSFSGCGRKESAPLSEGGEKSPATPAQTRGSPIQRANEQKLDPLTRMTRTLPEVMRAAPSA